MTIVAAIKLLTFIESVFLGVIAVKEDPYSRANRLFSFYIFFVAASCLVEFMLVASSTKTMFLFWKQFDTFMFFAVAALLHFSLIMYGVTWAASRKCYAVLYGVTLLIALIEGFVMRPLDTTFGRWSLVSVYPKSFLNVHTAFVLFSSACAAVSVVILFLCFRKATDRRIRTQAAILFTSTAALAIIGITVEAAVSLTHRTELPYSLTATSAFLVVNPILTFAVIRYGVLKLSPLSAAHTIMDIMTEAVIITDQTGVISYVNNAAQRLTGRNAASLAGSPFDGIGIQNSDINEGPLHFASVRNSGACLQNRECILNTSANMRVPVSLSSALLNSPPWGEIGLIISLRDITERKRMEELRDSAERLMRHDLRNTLTAVLSFSNLLQIDSSLTADQQQMVGHIFESAKLMKEQIDSYLYLRSIEDGSFSAPLEPVDLIEVLRLVVKNQQPLALSAKTDLLLTVDGNPDTGIESVEVMGIRSLLFGMFVNLVKNAIEADPPGSTIVLSTRTQDPPEVTVHNSAMIPKEIQSRFFTKLNLSGKKQGLGLGVYGSYLISRTFGCIIEMASAEKQGTTITVRFPQKNSNMRG